MPTGAAASPLRGVLDPSFGHRGRAFSRLGDSLAASEFTSMLRQPDGELLLTGWVEGEGRYKGEDFGIVERRTSTGQLDPSFGEGGTVPVGRVGMTGGVEGLALGEGGEILFGDSSDSCSTSATVRRLLPDGVPDPTFGKGGVSEAVPLTVHHLAVDSLGRIVVAGTANANHCGKSASPTFAAVARLRPDGSLDPGFGAGGVTLIGKPWEGPTNVVGLAVREDGTILLAASDFGSAGQLVALSPDGSLDTGFGADGSIQLIGGPRAMLALAGDEVVVVGSTAPFCCTQAGRFFLSRYLADGSLDPGFGEGGVARIGIEDVNEADAVASAPGGGFLLAGTTAPAASCYAGECDFTPVLARVDSAGALDPSYGQGGWTAFEIPGRSAGAGPSPRISGLAVDPSGRAVVAGGSGRFSDAFVVGRLADGQPDPAFGDGGTLNEVRVLPSSSEVAGMAIEAGGAILASAWSDVGTHGARPGLLSFRPNGRPDFRVGSGSGFAPTEVGGEMRIGAGQWAYMVRPAFGSDKGFVARFDSLGRRDPHYGAVELPPKFLVSSFLVKADGSLLLLGHVAHRWGMAAFQLDPRGDPELGFGQDGLAFVGFGRKVKAEAGEAAVDSRGRVVLLGRAGPRAVGVRLLASGRLDRRFAHGGRFRVGPDFWVESAALALAADDGILIAVSSETGHVGGVTLRRLGSDGALDRSFGEHGAVRLRRGGTPLLSIFPDRRQIVVVLARGAWGEGGVTLRAYRRNGDVDSRFGHDGVVMGATSRRHVFRPVAAVRQPNGRIVVAGTAGELEELGSRVELLRFR